VTALLLVAQQIAGRATSNTLFVTYYPVEWLPRGMFASACLSAAGVFGFASVLTRFGPARAVPWLFFTNAILFASEGAMAQALPRVSALAVYGHTALFGASLTSAFWSLVSERFDPHSARRIVSRVAGASTLGGVLGGLVVWRIGSHADVTSVPMGLAALNVCAFACIWPMVQKMPGGRAPPSSRLEAPLSPLGMMGSVGRSPYLRLVAWVVLLGAVVQSLLEFSLQANATATFGKGDKLLAFFAVFYTASGIVAFVLQTAAAGRVLDAVGLGGAVSVLPAAVMVSSLARPFLPPLSFAVLVRGVESAVRGSLFKAGYELLYTPLSGAKKRPTKTLIDVGVDRLGSAFGALITGAVVLLPAALHDRVLSGLAVAVSVVTFALSRLLRRAYVAALESNLRSGVVRFDQSELVDETTRRTVAETMDAMDRKRFLQSLLAEVENLRNQQSSSRAAMPAAGSSDPMGVVAAARSSRPGGSPPAGSQPGGPSSAAGSRPGASTSGSRMGGVPRPAATLPSLAESLPSDAPPDSIHRAVSDLRSGDTKRVRRVLSERALSESVTASLVVDAVAKPDLAADVLRYLRSVVDRIPGQVADAMLDPRRSPAVRRALPRVLGSSSRQAALDALILALEADDFDLRFRAAVAGSRIVVRYPTLRVPRDHVLALVRSEAVRQRTDPDVAEAGESRRRAGIEFIFTVLSLVMDREPLRLAYASLVADDAHLRGTAIEYLSAVLPAEVAEDIYPLLGVEAGAVRPARSRGELISELESSRDIIAAVAALGDSGRPPTPERS
jgi:hypothetical protein